jgi:Xaa-Pro dipeptidase
VLPNASRVAEVLAKLQRVRELLAGTGADGLLMAAQNNVSWITAGMQHEIIRGSDPGLVRGLITPSRAVLITQNIEGPRLIIEERIESLGFEVIQLPWFTDDWPRAAVDIVSVERLVNDGYGPGRSIADDLARVRSQLLPVELDRLRELGRDATKAVETAMRQVRVGMTERELAAELIRGLECFGVFPSVMLVGNDERRLSYRHPVATTSPIQKGALAVLVGVRDGLNICLSRSVSLGPIDSLNAEKHLVALRVETAEALATAPGNSWGQALQAGIAEYSAAGFPDEWRHHYQGGCVGYFPREFSPAPLEDPNTFTDEPVRLGQAGAWNPTVQGAKSEDTFIVAASGPEFVTVSSDWPVIDVSHAVGSLPRPAILEL